MQLAKNLCEYMWICCWTLQAAQFSLYLIMSQPESSRSHSSVTFTWISLICKFQRCQGIQEAGGSSALDFTGHARELPVQYSWRHSSTKLKLWQLRVEELQHIATLSSHVLTCQHLAHQGAETTSSSTALETMRLSRDPFADLILRFWCWYRKVSVFTF